MFGDLKKHKIQKSATKLIYQKQINFLIKLKRNRQNEISEKKLETFKT
jgi:hypothetical protein